MEWGESRIWRWRTVGGGVGKASCLPRGLEVENSSPTLFLSIQRSRLVHGSEVTGSVRSSCCYSSGPSPNKARGLHPLVVCHIEAQIAFMSQDHANALTVTSMPWSLFYFCRRFIYLQLQPMIGGWLLIYAAEGIMSNLMFTQFKAPNGRLLSLPAGASPHCYAQGVGRVALTSRLLPGLWLMISGL